MQQGKAVFFAADGITRAAVMPVYAVPLEQLYFAIDQRLVAFWRRTPQTVVIEVSQRTGVRGSWRLIAYHELAPGQQPCPAAPLPSRLVRADARTVLALLGQGEALHYVGALNGLKRYAIGPHRVGQPLARALLHARQLVAGETTVLEMTSPVAVRGTYTLAVRLAAS